MNDLLTSAAEPDRHKLLPTQKNDVHKAIRSLGFDPQHFHWDERKTRGESNLVIPILRHKLSGYYFEFDWQPQQSDFWVYYSPGESVTEQRALPGDWVSVYHHLEKWLRYVRREIDAPDLWEVISDQRALLNLAATSDSSNTRFTDEEQRAISIGLRQIRDEVVKTHGLLAQEVEFVRERFEYLEDASTRLGRKDWLMLALGIVFQIAVTPSQEPVQTGHLFRLLTNAIYQMLHGVLSLN